MEGDDAPPSFGDFLVRQLMPLYVKDVPFANLRVLAERYCGLSLDSDDEDRVWRAAGRHEGRPKVRASRASRRRPQPPAAASADNAIQGTAASGSAAKELFSQHVQAVQKPTFSGAKARFPTTLSVVQSENKQGLSDMPGSLMGTGARRGPKAATSTAAMRLISPALMMSPAPNSVRRALPAMSPVCMRGGMGATPRAEGAADPSWGLMDATPQHQRRL